ncbi:putative atp dependent rna protein [Neofusicoccum parvum UCRNP2]|uniref:RNA helicase n=1 Tax=Botryosphaeria parva (strain UCR-NP2) TaxID=1287680 RepID=R1G9K3_BOTPV|nr:putative atp dependent rna protein [Neofusicoccum parvum UCRNP2]
MADHDQDFVPSLFKPAALLPIARHRDALLYLIETFPVTIVVGHTGSGKTTQIPQFLDQAGWRVAATSVAARVAEEMGCNLGQGVGYSIRFEDVTSAATRIKFLTDGMLLREALVDPLLSRYSVIMVDEAHERSLSSDLLLGLLKKIRKKRPELRIVVSSATLQAEDFLRFFVGDAAKESNASGELGGSVGRIISLEGRMYPVDIHYLEQPAEDYVERAVKTVFDIHTQEPEGDILIFLTGREEIETALEMIADRAVNLDPKAPSIQALPLYAGLPTDQQMYVFDPAPENGKKDAKWCRDNYLNFKSMARAVSIRNQLRKYLERLGLNVEESLSSSSVLRVGGPDKAEQIRRCLTTGFFAHAARMQPDGTFKTIDGGMVLHAHPTSLMFNRKADWVIFHEIMETGNKTFIRDITKIEKNWLLEYAPQYYSTR